MTKPNKKGRAIWEITGEAKSNIATIRGAGRHSICFFNNKGGVGKTTLIANIGAALSLNYGLKVLLIDADPQCNLTQYVLSDDKFLDLYKSSSSPTIHSIIHPLSIGRGYNEVLPTVNSTAFGFDIIVGDPRLAMKEDLLAQDWRDARAGGTRGLRTTFVFRDLVSKADAYDLVLFDMGPSLGAINRAILLAVDFFVVPMAIDIFSIWAIQNIAEALRNWQKDLENGVQLAEDPDEIAGWRQRQMLRFLGYVTQQHKERTESGNTRIVEAYNEISERLPEEIKNRLGFLYDQTKLSPHIGDIKHLSSLAPKSQTLHNPMITVKLKGSYTTTRKQAREIYKQLCERFFENIAASLGEKIPSSTRRT